MEEGKYALILGSDKRRSASVVPLVVFLLNGGCVPCATSSFRISVTSAYRSRSCRYRVSSDRAGACTPVRPFPEDWRRPCTGCAGSSCTGDSCKAPPDEENPKPPQDVRACGIFDVHCSCVHHVSRNASTGRRSHILRSRASRCEACKGEGCHGRWRDQNRYRLGTGGRQSECGTGPVPRGRVLGTEIARTHFARANIQSKNRTDPFLITAAP